jgi:flagellar biosynthesis protein FlhF
MKEPEPFSFTKDKKVIIVIGPTGVGKTTTLAKLAANMVLTEKKKVGLVTSDTYRIAAVEQLKTYSEIIGVPLTIVYTPGEILNAIEGYKDKDLILVDTAGRSHKDKYQLMELKTLIKSSINYEVYLVMSATTKFSDCIEIIKNYSFLDDYKLLFTKMDETSAFGVILNVAYITKKPISYITTGQSVPDDIEIADNGKIINCLLGDKLYERSS